MLLLGRSGCSLSSAVSDQLNLFLNLFLCLKTPRVCWALQLTGDQAPARPTVIFHLQPEFLWVPIFNLMDFLVRVLTVVTALGNISSLAHIAALQTRYCFHAIIVLLFIWFTCNNLCNTASSTYLMYYISCPFLISSYFWRVVYLFHLLCRGIFHKGSLLCSLSTRLL